MSPQPGTPAQAPPAAPRQDVPRLRGKVLKVAAAPAALTVLVILVLAARVLVIVDEHKPTPAPPPLGLTTADIQARISIELMLHPPIANATVGYARCTRESATHATCVADVTGDGPDELKIDVLINPSTQSYEWYASAQSAQPGGHSTRPDALPARTRPVMRP